MNCPPAISSLFVARATLSGPLATDIITTEDLLSSEREALEAREERLASLKKTEFITAFAIVGFYATYQEATVALDWVRAGLTFV